MKDEKGVFSRASRTEEIEKYGKRIFCKTRQGVISGNPGLREMDERYVSDGPSEERICQTIEYTFTLLPRLSRYVNDGRISIDNNPVERAIRPLVLEEKTGSSAAMMPPHIAQQ